MADTSATGPVQAAPPVKTEDAAWVSLSTPFTAAELTAFCRHTEWLYRINPYYEFRRWQGTAPNSFHAEFRNLSNTQDVVTDLTVEEDTGGFVVRYAQGLKKRTVFTIAPAAGGSTLTITDDYAGMSESEKRERIDEVDKSLTAWGAALNAFFRRYKRWSWIAPWRWYMRRVWMNMKPSARRITWLVILITLVEFCFFLFVALIWWLEHLNR